MDALGHLVPAQSPEPALNPPPLLAVRDLHVAFAGRPVLRDVAFDLQPGAFCGLIGSNGSGKTTLLRSILGLVTPNRGSIAIAGSTRRPNIGYVPQKIQLDPLMPLRARDVVALGLDGHRFGFALPSRSRQAAVAAMLEAVDATAFADRRVGDLSGGQQQRIMIAHALVRRPNLLLLDEPLANLDLRSTAEVVALLHRLAIDQSITILMSAHDMNPLLGVIDRIVYLAHGRAVSGTIGEVVRGSVLSRLYGYHIDVIRVHGRVLVVAAGEASGLDAEVVCEPANVAQIR